MMAMLANEDVDVDDEDVKFVLAQCDDDGNGAISRDELLPMVAVWREMVNEKPKSRRATKEAPEEATPREAPISEEPSARAPGAAATPAPTASDAKADGPKAPEPKPTSKGSAACVIL